VAAARGGNINDVVVPLLLVTQLDRVPVTVTGYMWLSVVRNIQKNVFTARFGNFDHRIGR